MALQPPDVPRTPDLRASDADRHRMVETLRHHCSEGRLTLDEFSERVGEAYAARTLADLERVTEGLPVPAPPTAPAPAAAPGWPAAPHREPTHWVVGIMAGAQRRGRWRPGEHTTAFALMGGCMLDLRQAEIDTPEVSITAIAIMGGIDIVVPEGVAVEMTGLAIMGGKDCRVGDVPRRPGTPVVKVQVFAFWGGVSVRTKRPPAAPRRQRAQPKAVERGHRYEKMVRDVRPPAVDGTVTVLFSDIEDFTGITERLGDMKAQEVLHAHNEIVRTQIAEHGGHEVKCQGDSFMISFDGARRALRCAVGVQREFAAYAQSHPDEPLRVRVGLHTGEAIREDSDLFGKTVIVASRIAGLAAGEEVLVSSLMKELTDSSGEFHFGPPRQVELKGLAAPQTVYPVLWLEGA